MKGRPRKYPFAQLGEGDRLIVALNGNPADRVASNLYGSARHYAASADPTFRCRSLAGFVVLERLGPLGRRGLKIARAEARLRRWITISAERPLRDREIASLKSDNRLLRRAAA